MDDLKRTTETRFLPKERKILRELVEFWNAGCTANGHEGPAWGYLHDLAYLYLVLAHGADDDLSEAEVQVMMNKLREWRPDVSIEEVAGVLARALGAYAEGESAVRVESAVRSVRESLPHEKRMAALNDLIKIANADGLFLDREEDLINHLMREWDVGSYGDYVGGLGSKE